MKKIFLTILIASFLFLTKGAFAFSTIETEVTASNEAETTISVFLKTDKEINAVSLDFALPIYFETCKPNCFEVSRVDDGGSIINLWLEKPTIEEESVYVRLSGIIPGGFSERGKLFNFVVRNVTPGAYHFSVENFNAYINGPDGKKDEVSREVKDLVIINETIKSTQDKEKPESFEITLIKDVALNNNKWSALFVTSDKGSGIAKYEIAEKRQDEVGETDTLKWKKVESPALLSDQSLKSFIYVRVTDWAGNERIQVLPPQYPITPTERIVFQTIPYIIILLIGYMVWRLWRREFTMK
jgi:hypothetical protein